jgi:competence protein ComFC
MFQVDDCLCSRCRHLMKYEPGMYQGPGFRFEGLYVYEGQVREMMLQYKENCDEALFCTFLFPYVRGLNRKYRRFTIVPVPSSEDMVNRRGFQHVRKMFSVLDLPIRELIVKTADVQQKSSISRKQIGSYFQLSENQLPENTRILLVDDIVTTGESMGACYRLLSQKYPRIRCLAVSHGKQFVKNAKE